MSFDQVQNNAERQRPAQLNLQIFLKCLLAGFAYYLATKVAFILCLLDSKVSLVFPPYAVLVSILLFVPIHHWWAYVLAAICGHRLATWQAHWPFLYSLHCEVFDAVKNVSTAAGIRFLTRPPLKLATLHEAIVVIAVAAIIVPVFTSFWGAALTISNHYGTHYWVEWRNLALSNAVTAMALLPGFIIAFAHAKDWRKRRKFNGLLLAEASLLTVGLLATGVYVFSMERAGIDNSPALLYLPVSFLIWAALRFGPLETSVSLLAVWVLAIWGAMQGKGPFLAHSPAENTLALQFFFLVVSIPLMLLAVGMRERKHSVTALRESEKRFRAMADTAPVMIWVSDPDMRCTFFNQVWLSFTGRSLEQELGTGWAEGVYAEDHEQCLKVYTNSFEARRAYTMEYRLRRKDGEYCWLLHKGAPRFSQDGEFLGYIVSCLDITEIKRSEARMRLVIEAAPNAMIMIDSDRKITLVNAQVETVFGYGRSELLGHPIEMLIPERLRTAYLDHCSTIFGKPSAPAMDVGRDLFGRHKDGHEVPVEIGFNPISLPEGPLILVSIIDITERMRAELERERQRHELAHMSRVAMLGELTSTIAHELNQPLTAILSNAQAARRFLAGESPSHEHLHEILDDIISDDKRAGQIITRLRALARKEPVSHETFCLNDTLREVTRILHGELVEHHIKLDVELMPALPLVNAGSIEIQQVMMNLIINAMQAQSKTALNLRKIHICTEQVNSSVAMLIRDAGCGIAEETLSNIFEPFVTTRSNGLGMGLAICRRLVEAYGGSIHAHNNENGGATFSFTLPVAAKKASVSGDGA